MTDETTETEQNAEAVSPVDVLVMPYLFYSKEVNLEKIVNDGFKQIEEGEGFDYIVGHIRGGKLKVVFEPDSNDFQSAVIDGVEGFGFTMVREA